MINTASLKLEMEELLDVGDWFKYIHRISSYDIECLHDFIRRQSEYIDKLEDYKFRYESCSK